MEVPEAEYPGIVKSRCCGASILRRKKSRSVILPYSIIRVGVQWNNKLQYLRQWLRKAWWAKKKKKNEGERVQKRHQDYDLSRSLFFLEIFTGRPFASADSSGSSEYLKVTPGFERTSANLHSLAATNGSRTWGGWKGFWLTTDTVGDPITVVLYKDFQLRGCRE